MVSGLTAVFLVVIYIWLIVLSFILFKLLNNINIILKESKKQNILEILNSIIKNQSSFEKNMADLKRSQEIIEDLSSNYYQKTGLIRFNPFSDTGGEQSFILSLLDKKNTGVVISGLYARSGMRWYIKKVVNGKGLEHELSEEEKKAVDSAR